MFANWNAGMEKSLYRNGRHADDAATVHESWKKNIVFVYFLNIKSYECSGSCTVV